ncbi:MAG: hypothetical protein ACJATI_002526 [Halioglobus sp.]|jgi:hypothetical protein
MEPFNFRQFHLIKVPAYHYIKPENVNLSEVHYSFSIGNSHHYTDGRIFSTKYGIDSLSMYFPFRDLDMLDFHDLYSEDQISARVVHEVLRIRIRSSRNSLGAPTKILD